MIKKTKQIIEALKLDLHISKPTEKPSLLAYNIVWFSNCSWMSQIKAFDQLYRYL